MKRIDVPFFLSALAQVAAWSGNAHAAVTPQTATIMVKGSADQLCTLGAPQVNVGGSTNIGNFSGSTVTIAELADDNTFSTRATDFDVTFAASCNFDHKLTVSSDFNGLWLVAGAGSHTGFADAVPYSATVSWGGETGLLRATAASEGEVDEPLNINQPAYGNITIHFEIDQGATNAGTGTPLVAGTYQDILRVTMGAQ